VRTGVTGATVVYAFREFVYPYWPLQSAATAAAPAARTAEKDSIRASVFIERLQWSETVDGTEPAGREAWEKARQTARAEATIRVVVARSIGARPKALP